MINNKIIEYNNKIHQWNKIGKEIINKPIKVLSPNIEYIKEDVKQKLRCVLNEDTCVVK